MCFNYLHTLLGKIFKYFAHLIIVFLCFILGCKSFIYIFKVQIWKRRCTYYWQAIFASIKMKILHIDAFLHSFLNCLLKSRHSLCHVWRGNSRDCLSPQGFQDGKEIYIYIPSHRMLWWVLWACNLCIEFRRAFQRKKCEH